MNRARLRSGMLLLAGLVTATSAFAQASRGSHGTHGGAPPAGAAAPRVELGATAAFDAGGRLWATYKEGGYVVVRQSPDLGLTWSEPRRVSPTGEPVAAEGEARPKIAIGSGGELYVTWTKPLSKPYTGEIRFSRSLDAGATFSAPTTVHADRQEITHRFDSIGVGREGRLFVAWIDKRDLEANKSGGSSYRGAAVYLAISDDRGASFRGDYKLADHSCECCRIALLPRDDGGVTALWRHVFAPNIRDHALATLAADGTAGSVTRATFDDWRVDACPHHGPSLGADEAGRLHAVWFTQAPGREGAWYGRLRDGPPAGMRRIGSDRAEHPDLAASGKRLAIAWKEFDGERTLLRATTSEDAGETWRNHDLGATAGPSDQPRVLAANGRFYVFWNTRREPLSVKALP